LDEQSPNNWLDDNFWLNYAYLDSRAPLLINTNWWLAFVDDIQTKDQFLKMQEEQSRSKSHLFTSFQIRRAAWLLHRIADFKLKMDA
jgi:hypothetical protein